jgi:hypothetical protein
VSQSRESPNIPNIPVIIPARAATIRIAGTMNHLFVLVFLGAMAKPIKLV